jgi:PleD family two-component response regulator
MRPLFCLRNKPRSGISIDAVDDAGTKELTTPRMQANTGNAEIVMLDDGSSYLEIFRLLLEKEGYRVRKAENQERARLLITSQKPDLLILDVVYQDFDPLDFYASIRQTLGDTDLPILFLTSLITGDMAETLNRGPKEHAMILPRQEKAEKILSAIEAMIADA